MQEWIIAMLVISALLIIRDMAKTILTEIHAREEDIENPYVQNPHQSRAEKCAQSFQKLAENFYGMPFRREYLSNQQMEYIIRQTREKACEGCYQRENCWSERGEQTTKGIVQMLHAMEQQDEAGMDKRKKEWMCLCVHVPSFLNEIETNYYKARQELVWCNRMIENRLAVGEQLTEVSRIIQSVVTEFYQMTPGSLEFTEKLKKRLRKHHIILKRVVLVKQKSGKREVLLTLRARSGQCVSAMEVARELSILGENSMSPSMDSRCTINTEFRTYCFVESVNYQVLYGVAKMTKECEKVSGDNFVCNQEMEEMFFMCLSDGMGSGLEASRESEKVVELMDQLIEAGITQETAARLVNSSLVLTRQEDMYSTLDTCTVDLYSGICTILKAGASTTFIKRDHWVEAISSTSLAAGLMQQADFEITSRKLYHGDYLIMVTDGVLDSLPMEKEEEVMKEIIMQVHSQTPKELGRGILERVLSYCQYVPRDDMTVLVAGMWEK